MLTTYCSFLPWRKFCGY